MSMLTEVDYSDMNGSVCWFCGCDLKIVELNEKPAFNIKTYRCECEQGHTSFVQHRWVEDNFDANLTIHLFIYTDDYYDHVEVNNLQVLSYYYK